MPVNEWLPGTAVLRILFGNDNFSQNGRGNKHEQAGGVNRAGVRELVDEDIA